MGPHTLKDTLPLKPSEPVWRTREIEEATNLHFIHPIASWLTLRFARLGIPPNLVSLAGLSFGIAAGFAYYHYQNALWTVAGFMLMIGWHVMDGADGQLARLTNSQSRLGEIVDGYCDHCTFAAVYTGFGLALAHRYGPYVWPLILIAGLSHALQAAAYEMQRQEYDYWGYQLKSAELPRLSELRASPENTTLLHRALNPLFIVFLKVQHPIFGSTSVFRERLARELQRKSGSAKSVEATRRRYRELFAPSIRRWSVLSSNYRTLAIFVCALIGFPLIYFLLEISALNLVLLMLLRRQRALCERFLQELTHDDIRQPAAELA
jgi:phosphatidylglycerophosphate synthase